MHTQMTQTDWHIMVINNTPQTLNGLTAKTSIYNTDGTVKYTHTHPVTASPSAVPIAKNKTYTVRLHFAENKLPPSGRKFNRDINTKRVLNDFGIAAEPKLCGIQVLPMTK